MMPELNQFIENIPQMDAAFVNHILQATLAPLGASVVAVRHEPLTGYNAFNATLLRLFLTYAQPAPTAPQTLIAKLPTPNVSLHEKAAVFQPGTRENWFYNSIAPQSPVRVPTCYFNKTQRATNESILILEDLGAHPTGNWLAGASLPQAEVAVKTMARLHARWWNDAQSDEMQALTDVIAPKFEQEVLLVQSLYDAGWPRFVTQFGERLPDEARKFGEALVGNTAVTDHLIAQATPTLAHGDFRLDNLHFGEVDGEPACWVIDWEDCFFGSGMIDLSWFLGGCLSIEHSQHERPLLKTYHTTLLANGVADYAWERCLYDYYCGMTSSFIQGVLSGIVDDDATAHEKQLARTIGERFIDVVGRLPLMDLVK